MPDNYLIQAPFPATEVLLVLPEPNLGDGERPESRVSTVRSMDGTLYTHTIKQPNHRTHRWTFDLPRKKALEFFEVYKAFSGDTWSVQRASDTLVGNVKINPFTLEMISRGVHANSEEVVAVEIEFETTQ